MNESEQWNMYFTAIILFFTWYTVIKEGTVVNAFWTVVVPALVFSILTIGIISFFIKRKRA